MDEPPARVEPLSACVARTVLLAALGGVVVGALESLELIAQGEVRYLRWAGIVVAVAAGGYAAAGALLALPSALLARVLHGRPKHRAAAPSVCAGLGTILALAAFVAVRSMSGSTLAATALGGTLLFVALRELLAWWPRLGRPGTWMVLAVLAVAASGAVATSKLLKAPSAGRSAGPNVLHVSIDTLRADHLGCYGYDAARTPAIDRLASEGALFEDATSQANTTGPSHATQLTGLLPVEHGAVSNGVPLREAVPTLPEILSERGWDTAGFVSGYTLLDRACGLAGRFGWYDDTLLAWQWMPQVCEELAVAERLLFRLAARRGVEVTRLDRPADETVDAALAWLDRRAGDARPVYLFLHLYDPHAPYEPPPGLVPPGEREIDDLAADWYELEPEEREAVVADEAARRRMVELYDGEIAHADTQLARVLARFDALGETLVIVTSDHGEGLGSHGYWFDHGTFLYDEELRVPLVARFPGGPSGVRVAGQVRLLDLTPTVLAALDVECPEVSGSSLLPLAGGAPYAPRPSFAIAADENRTSLRASGFKLIHVPARWHDTQRFAAGLELYDLGDDPAELAGLLETDAPPPPVFEALRDQLDAWRAASEGARRTGDLDPELVERLRRLGYL